MMQTSIKHLCSTYQKGALLWNDENSNIKNSLDAYQMALVKRALNIRYSIEYVFAFNSFYIV